MDPVYLVQQPKNLETLAITKLGEWVMLQAEKFMSPELHANRLQVMLSKWPCNSRKAEVSLSRNIEIIRTAFECNVPRMLHDQLATEVMRALSNLLEKIKVVLKRNRLKSGQRNAILRITETLFTKNLTSLIIYYHDMVKLRDSLISKSYMLTSLTRLELHFTQGYLDIISENDFIQILKTLPSLKYLTLHRIGTDNILRCLVENCKFIEELDLIFSNEITDMSIDMLNQFMHLKNVNLSDTSVTEKGIAHLLTSCANIEVIVNFYSNTIACAIEHIASFEENTGKQFKFKSYSNHMETTHEQLKLIIQMCPQIQDMHLDKYESKITNTEGLVVLDKLQNLRILKLEDFYFYADRLKELLQARGSNLVHLHLTAVQQMDLKALMYIGEMCPNLESLSIEGGPLEYDKFHKKGTVLKIPPFRYLKRLVFYVTGRESQSIDEELVFLLSNCPKVEFIGTVSLTDDIMLRVLDKNPLLFLRKLKMLRSNLTASVIERITQNCINPPTVKNYPMCLFVDSD